VTQVSGVHTASRLLPIEGALVACVATNAFSIQFVGNTSKPRWERPDRQYAYYATAQTNRHRRMRAKPPALFSAGV